MKKALKSGLIWGGTVAVLGGIVTGITVPIVLNSNQIKELGHHIKANDPIYDGFTFNDLDQSTDDAGSKEITLLSKAEYQLSFKLYEEEQRGSIDIQKAFLDWDQYQSKKELYSLLVSDSDLKLDGEQDDISQSTFSADNLNRPQFISNIDFDNYFNAAQEAKDAIDTTSGTNEENDVQITKQERINDQLTSLRKKYDQTNELIDKLTNNEKQIYDSSTWKNDYPKLLLPIDNIREKQDSIFEDAKNAFIDGFETYEAGLNEWQTEISNRYNGATSKEAALDYLVGNQVTQESFARYKYKLNSDYTLEQVASGIFSKVLNITDQEAQTIATQIDNDNVASITNKLFINTTTNLDKAKKIAEKVYFMGTTSHIIDLGDNHINLLNPGLTNIETDKLGKLAKVENAIIGLAPNFEDKNGPWGFGSSIQAKDGLFNLLRASMFDGNVISGYSSGNEIFGSDDNLSDFLIGQNTATQDSARWKGGDYGWKAQLENIGKVDSETGASSMVPGFGNGLIAALKDIDDTINTIINEAANKSTLIDLIYKSVGDALAKLWYEKEGDGDYVEVSGNDVTLDIPTAQGEIVSYNQSIKRFIDSLTDDEISSSIGRSIRDAMITNDVTNSDGQMPLVIDLGLSNTSHKYIVTSEEFGMHYIRVSTQATLNANMAVDLQIIATEQNTSKTATDYDILLGSLSSRNNMLSDLLELQEPINSGDSPTFANNNEWIEFLKTKYNELGYELSEVDTLVQDLADVLYSTKASEAITKVDAVVPTSYYDWMINKIDGNIIQEELFDSGLAQINPEDIYKWALEMEVNNG